MIDKSAVSQEELEKLSPEELEERMLDIMMEARKEKMAGLNPEERTKEEERLHRETEEFVKEMRLKTARHEVCASKSFPSVSCKPPTPT